MKKNIFNKSILLIVVMLFVVLLSSYSSVKSFTTDEMDTFDVEYIEDGDLYISDDYFRKASTKYNPHLASLSMVFANSSSPAGNPKSKDDEAWFHNQTGRLEKFFNKIHYTDFDCNEDYRLPCDFDTIGIGAAKREIDDDYTVVAVSPRSGGYFREWANNFFIGSGNNSDNMHEGWYNAAIKLLSFLDDYVTNHVNTPKIKLWLVGFSRGGATANIAAALLDNKIANKQKLFTCDVILDANDLFCYTFEAPQGANYNSKTVKKPKDSIYNNIFNIINPNDLVPKVAMSEWGFTRFGIDKYVTTKFYDPENYNENNRTFNTLLGIISPGDIYNPDYFKMYNLSNTFSVEDDVTKKNYDSNIAVSILLEEVTKNVESRSNYANYYGPGIQGVLLTIMDYNYIIDLDLAKRSVPTALAGIIFGTIVYAGTKNIDLVEATVHELNLGLGMPNKLVMLCVEKLVPLLEPVIRTFFNHPNELVSIGKCMSNIFENHNTEVTLARIHAQDSYYINAYNNNPEHKDKIKLVPFMDNADYVRMTFNGMNDIGLYVNGARKISIDGYVFGKSDVTECADGYAAGYYSYSNVENIEIFMPLGNTYTITMKDYSKKLYHSLSYSAYIKYFSLGPNGETSTVKDSFSDTAWFNSDRYVRTVKID